MVKAILLDERAFVPGGFPLGKWGRPFLLVTLSLFCRIMAVACRLQKVLAGEWMKY